MRTKEDAMRWMTGVWGWCRGHVARVAGDRGWSTLEATLLLAAAGTAALALVAAFSGVFDGLLSDFQGVFGD